MAQTIATGGLPLYPCGSLLNELEIERQQMLLNGLPKGDDRAIPVRLHLVAAKTLRAAGEIPASNYHLRLNNRKMGWIGWID